MSLQVGVVDGWKLTSGGAGNQWTTIDGVVYATYLDFAQTKWKIGDVVVHRPYMAPLWSGNPPIPHTTIDNLPVETKGETLC